MTNSEFLTKSFGQGFQLDHRPGSRVVSITEYPHVGHLKDTGHEYADLGLGELNGFHRMGLGVEPGIQKTFTIDTSGYDLYKILEHLGPHYGMMEQFGQGPNMLPSLGLPSTGFEGFNNVDRGSNFYGFGDPYNLNTPLDQLQPGQKGTIIGPVAMDGQLQLMATGGQVLI